VPLPTIPRCQEVLSASSPRHLALVFSAVQELLSGASCSCHFGGRVRAAEFCTEQTEADRVTHCFLLVCRPQVRWERRRVGEGSENGAQYGNNFPPQPRSWKTVTNSRASFACPSGWRWTSAASRILSSEGITEKGATKCPALP
jgi:hypothetical protein